MTSKRGPKVGSKNRSREQKLADGIAELARRRGVKAAREVAAVEYNRRKCREYYRHRVMATIPREPMDEADYLRSIGAPAPTIASTLEPGRVFRISGR